MRASVLSLTLVVLMGASPAQAGDRGAEPPADWRGDNAALRYWVAIHSQVKIEDPEMLADDVATGQAPYDARFDAHLDANAATLKALRQGARMEHCSFGIAFEDGFAAELPQLMEMRRLAFLLLLDARRLAARGQAREALETTLDVVTIGRHVGEDRLLVNALVGVAVANLGALVAGDLIARHPEALDLRRVLALPDLPVDLGASLDGEAYCFRRTFEELRRRVLESPRPITWRELMHDIVGEVGAGPDPDAIVTPESFDAHVKPAIREYERVMAEAKRGFALPRADSIRVLAALEAGMAERHALVQLVAPVVLRAGDTQRRGSAHLRALKIFAALVDHHARTGKPPDDLAALAPVLGGAVPLDPLTDAPFRLVRTPASIAVVSTEEVPEDNTPLGFELELK